MYSPSHLSPSMAGDMLGGGKDYTTRERMEGLPNEVRNVFVPK